MRTRDRYRTQFCFIGPGSMLDRYAIASRTHLVLPQVTNEQYREFYIRKRREGDFIILDNGAYEGVENWTLLLEGIQRYSPHVVCLPDFLLTDGGLTYSVAGDFLSAQKANYPDVKWMYIPQSEPGDLRGFYSWMNKAIKTIKPDWIGVPRALTTHVATGENAKFARIDLVEELTMRGIKTHALGMANGSLWELDRLAWEGVCSVDSSCAIWRGLFDHDLDNEIHRERWDQKGTAVDFDCKFELTFSDQSIRHNINLVLAACGKEPFRG